MRMVSRRGCRAVAASALVAAAGLSAAVTAGAHAATPVTPADARLDRALERLVAAPGGPPGAIAVVRRGSRRVVLDQGVRDLRTRRRIALGDRWRIASVSKAFSGAVALRLVEQGRLSLDDTIAGRLPGLPAAWGAVTLAQLLQHTSGLPDYSADPAFARDLGADPRRPVMPRTLIDYVAGQPLRFAPGSAYRYSNTDNVVVALFAEAATGLSYERVLSHLVLDPLALRRTSMPLGWRMPAPYVHGYDNNASGPREDASELVNMSQIWASGGLVSAPLDLGVFARAYAGGRLFGGAARRAQLTTFRPGSSDPVGPGVNEAGLGIFRYRTSCGVVYGHTGTFLGYTTFMGATADGRRSATVQVSTQLDPVHGERAAVRALRRAFDRAACAALAR